MCIVVLQLCNEFMFFWKMDWSILFFVKIINFNQLNVLKIQEFLYDLCIVFINLWSVLYYFKLILWIYIFFKIVV